MEPKSPESPEVASNEVDGARIGRPGARPRPPRQPELEDCCRSGCTPCVFDLYDAAMERYELALAVWLARHPNST
jgi:hypothetical protein